ncbi:MAG: DNA topoisomerase IV subunit A [Candidatus Ancillula trichonymphae]|nr:DNA topoisomerase IV subunit A [Candidatus Ancillula trichonymphae]
MSERIQDEDINSEIETSFLEYAYSVIYARALPDARDGLKPVQRRILFQMDQMRLTPDRPYIKSARVVGDVMGKLHPHGDSAIYDAMVRMAQPFSLRLTLVDGHGNFGSLDDGPAAARYTEVKMTAAAVLMCESLDEDTVDFEPNYDNKLKQPVVLSSAIPNLLVNGASGIAIGMATNMPPHNLREVIHGAVFLLDNPSARLEGLMRYVKGPDLPGGAKIVGLDTIKEAYAVGRGIFKMRAETSIEKVSAKKQGIVVTELPYGVGPEKVIEKVSECVRARKLEGITGITDLTDRKSGLKLQIEIKNGYNPRAILAKLYKLTPLEESFGINNVALVNGAPQTLGLLQLLQVWIDHRLEVVRRRTQFRLSAAKDRLHLVEGLLIAILDIDEVIEVIRSSEDTAEASIRLQNIFELDEIQTTYILDLRLRRLTKFSRVELENEKSNLLAEIAGLEGILGSREKLKDAVKCEMHEVAQQFGDNRRTVLLNNDEQTTTSTDLLAEFTGAVSSSEAQNKQNGENSALEIPDVPCYIYLGATGLVAAVLVRGGQRATLEENRSPHDAISRIIRSSTRSNFGVLTSHGRVFLVSALDLPQLAVNPDNAFSGLSGGVALYNLLDGLQKTETPVTVMNLYTTEEELKTAPAFAIGTTFGVVKRVRPELVPTDRSGNLHNVFEYIILQEGDSVIGGGMAPDDAELVFISTDSNLLRFSASAVRPQGRIAGGMAGIKLQDGQKVIFFGAVSEKDALVFTVAGDGMTLVNTQTGFGKLTPLELYPSKGRATGGVRSQKFLKGQNSLIYAWVGGQDIRANTATGSPAELPEIDMRRDASGSKLSAVVTAVGSAGSTELRIAKR